ncbi:MAG: UvrB/UvrC motif-containing protein, partial [Youngiibacter sp.]|nr:UvrB/UvrC motif-containing protein [Youngiibacter sp.]
LVCFCFLSDLWLGDNYVLVLKNLFSVGLSLRYVAFGALLDADKEGFLRSETSLIQTIGRAARNSESRVIMYADVRTGSMDRAIGETYRRRKIQVEFNELNGITPTTVVKDIREVIEITKVADEIEEFKSLEDAVKFNKENLEKTIKKLELDMYKASKELEFEKAAYLRDEIGKLKKELIRNKN